jgi:MoaA/NifB/PqqE/SkfB family radical SAM enzyme
MCHRWKKAAENEISVEKIREVFSSRLFSRVEYVNIHGGEPTLRRDLAKIFEIIQKGCPKLRHFWLSTNGLNPRRIQARVQEILDIVDFKRIKSMPISVSIDGSKSTHEKIRGVRGGFDQAVETIQILKDMTQAYPIEINISTVIQPLNLGEIDAIQALATSLGVSIYFMPLMLDTFFNLDPEPNLLFANTDLEVLRRVVEKRCLKDDTLISLYWQDFLGQMAGEKRSIPCAFDRYVISLYPTGEILPCSRRDWILYGNVYEQSVDDIWFSSEARKIRQRMIRQVCPSCNNMCQVEFSLAEEFFTYARYYFRKHIFSLSK